MKKNPVFLILIFFVASLFVSCAQLEVRSNDSEKYGSLIIGSSARSLCEIDEIISARVSVTGSGITTPISKTTSEVINGTGSVEITNIPVGKNRIITVQALDAFEKALEGGTIRALCDINPGVNNVLLVNRETSRRANVYNELFINNYDISSLSLPENSSLCAALESIIPNEEDCPSPEQIDYQTIALDFLDYVNTNAPLKSVDDYILPEEAYIKQLKIEQTTSSTQEKPIFKAIAIYSDETQKDVSENATWFSSDQNKATVNFGEVDLLTEGKTEIYAEFSENRIKRISPKVTLDIKNEIAGSRYLYLDISGTVNYATGNSTTVAAWMWGKKLVSVWGFLEKINDNYMRIEVPYGADNIIFARGKNYRTDGEVGFCDDDEENENTWNENYPETIWNKSQDLTVPLDEKNTWTPSEWGGNGMNDGANGTWSYVDHHDIIENRIYATIAVESSEDDPTLKLIKVDGNEIPVQRQTLITYPYANDGENKTVCIEVQTNFEGATYTISPASSAIVDNGCVVNFEITVTSKDEKNTQTYIVRAKRSGTAPVNLEAYKNKCYLEEGDLVTLIYAPSVWNDSKDSIQSIMVKGSFTSSYNEQTKRWVENAEDFTLEWNDTFEAFTKTYPKEKVRRPGYVSGQSEFRFYRNGLIVSLDNNTHLEEKYIFGDQQIIIFDGDDEAKIAKNKTFASTIKELSDFTSSEEDMKKIANFRQVPGTTKLYRSYHPFYPNHLSVPTEKLRMQKVVEFATSVGINSDINLCNDRTPKEGHQVTYSDNSTATITIPDYYKTIINNNRVLYVGDNDSFYPERNGNGYIPNGKLVYYHSHSKIFAQWISQTLQFIAEKPGPYQIHCEIGVDRTGVFCAVLAGLCGASWSSILDDFEKSNEMGIGEYRDGRALKYSMENMLGIENIESETNLKSLLENYFVGTGEVTQQQITSAVNNLK